MTFLKEIFVFEYRLCCKFQKHTLQNSQSNFAKSLVHSKKSFFVSEFSLGHDRLLNFTINS